MGVGGEYPIASASASERAEADASLQQRRGETVMLTFSMQGECPREGESSNAEGRVPRFSMQGGCRCARGRSSAAEGPKPCDALP